MTEWVSNINPVLVAIGAALLSLRCMHNWDRPESPLEFGVFLIVSFLIYFSMLTCLRTVETVAMRRQLPAKAGTV